MKTKNEENRGKWQQSENATQILQMNVIKL